MKNLKTWIEISKSKLLKNAAQIKKTIGKKVLLMAVIKANAYGHGLEEVVSILNLSPYVDYFGVDSIEEAILTRKFTKKSILVLGYIPQDLLEQVFKNNIEISVCRKDIILNLEKLAEKYKKRIAIHIKLDTGMSRQGIFSEELLDFIKLIKQNSLIDIKGIWTHFAYADSASKAYTNFQLKNFKKLLSLFRKNNISIPLIHAANSAAAVLYPKSRFNMVRSGIMIYGYFPSDYVRQKSEKLRLNQILSWKCHIAQIKNIKKGIKISYGITETAKKDLKIAILPVGYYDGYDRKLSNIGAVLIRGRRCRILGRVCMNMIIVDVSNIRGIKLKDNAVLIGKSMNDFISANEISQKIGTINYEVLTRLNPKIKKIIVL